MTLHRIKHAALALASLAICFTSAPGRSAVITKDYGSGSDAVHLLLQFAGGADSVLYTYHFTYSASSPLTGSALFLALDNADTSLSLAYSGSASSNFFVTDVNYNGSSEPTSTQLADGYSWNYFDAGGLEQAYDSNFNPIPDTYNTVASGSWNLANAGASDRILQPDSWDAWVLGAWVEETDSDGFPTGVFDYVGAQPSVSPVPEPTSIALVVLGGGALLWSRRRSHA